MAKTAELKEKSAGDQSLAKVLSLLKKMALTCELLSVAEITEGLKVSKPTGYSIVNTLCAQGFLEKDADSGKYRIGYLFYALGQNYPRMYPFLNYMEGIVLEEHKRLGLRINICVFKPPLTALVVASKDESLIPRHSGGLTLPAHLSASGKVLLAALPQQTAEEYVSQADLYPMTAKTITDTKTLMEHIEIVRRQGYATDEEEFVPGSACVAAPIYDASGKVICSISISKCPIERFRVERDSLILAVQNLAMHLSFELGLPRELGHNYFR